MISDNLLDRLRSLNSEKLLIEPTVEVRQGIRTEARQSQRRRGEGQAALQLSLSVAAYFGDSDLADLTEEVSKAEVVEPSAVFGAAPKPGEDAELGLVFAIVDQLPTVRVGHAPDQPAVQEQLMEIFLVVVLPGDVMPLGVPDTDHRRLADNPLGAFLWIEVLPSWDSLSQGLSPRKSRT